MGRTRVRGWRPTGAARFRQASAGLAPAQGGVQGQGHTTSVSCQPQAQGQGRRVRQGRAWAIPCRTPRLEDPSGRPECMLASMLASIVLRWNVSPSELAAREMTSTFPEFSKRY